MLNTLKELFSGARNPVFIGQKGRALYKNPAAGETELSEEILDRPAPFVGAFTDGEQSWQINAAPAGEYTVYTLYRMENENRELLAAIGSNISDRLAQLTLAAGCLDEYCGDTQSREYMAMLRHSIHSIRRIAGNMRWLGGSETGGRESVHDLDELIGDLVHSVNAILTPDKPIIEFRTDSKEKAFKGDGQLVERVILNLLSNSIRVTPKGGRIRVNLTAKNKNAVITVTDTGGGIPENILPVLFASYNTRRELERSDEIGMGLAVTHSIVRGLGGTILASNSNKGAEFTVLLPLLDELPGFRSPSERYVTKGMSMLHTELSEVLSWESYLDKLSD